MTSIILENLEEHQIQELVGPNDCHLNVLSQCLHKEISYRENQIFIQNCSLEERNDIEVILNNLVQLIKDGKTIQSQDITYACRIFKREGQIDLHTLRSHSVGRTLDGKMISPKTIGQYHFVKELEEKDIVFAYGPAGTGKTYLAVIYAVTQLKKGNVKRIVLTRPAVEAGENLGFLPGDLKEKVDPYLTPLYDALHAMLGNETTDKLIEKGTIEIAPLAYMRGRTLDDSYILLDEAQNTTASQMKMFLTRLGHHSRMVISGDVTQIDLNGKQESGLVQAIRILEGMDDIAFCKLSSDDVVRHPLVQKIIERYENIGKGNK